MECYSVNTIRASLHAGSEKQVNLYSEEKLLYISSRANGQIYLKFPKEFRKKAAALLEAQMWALGFDIRNPATNLLTEFGFTKKSPVASQYGTSSYILDTENGYRITLWGFAVIVSSFDSGSIIIRRHCFTPLWSQDFVSAEGCFDVFNLPVFYEPVGSKDCFAAVRLLKELIRILNRYEMWVEKRAGAQYRIETLRRGKKPVRKFSRLSLRNEWERIYTMI